MRSASLGINPYLLLIVFDLLSTPMHIIPRKYWISTSEFITSSLSPSHTPYIMRKSVSVVKKEWSATFYRIG